MVNKLESGHFKGKGVSDIRLRIAHFDNPDLEPVDPAELGLLEGEGSKAYEKFLVQYTAMYNASLVPPEEDPDPEPEPEPVPTLGLPDPTPTIDPPEPDATPSGGTSTPPIEAPATAPAEEPLNPEPDPIIVVPPTLEPDPVIVVPPLVIDPIVVPEPPEPDESDAGDGALAAFEEIIEEQVPPSEPETVDVVV